MKRLSLAVITFLLAALGTHAQSGFTQVSAVVLDPTGVPYAGCHGNASFVPSPSATTFPTIGGSTFPTTAVIAACDSFGNFTLVLADNNQVVDGHTSPPASQWQFNIVAREGNPSFICTMTITGVSQNITSQIQACAAPLPTPKANSFASVTVQQSATPTFTGNGNTGFIFLLNQNVTSSTFTTNAPAGTSPVYQINICQDSVGGHTMVWPSNVTLPPNYLFNVGANTCSPVSFIYNPNTQTWSPWQVIAPIGASLPFSTIPFSTTPSFLGTPGGSSYGMTLTNNVTSSTVTGFPVNGNIMKLHICQGAGGPWTFAFPANFLNTTAIQNTGCTDETYSFDGTNWSQLTQPAGGGGGGGGACSAAGSQGTIQAAGTAGACQTTNLVESATGLAINEDEQHKGPNPDADGRFYGMRAVTSNAVPAIPGITATCNGTTAVTLSSASIFINGDGIDLWGCGATNALSTPSAPTVTPSLAQGSTGTGYVVNGPTGATSYGYEIVAFDAGEGVTAASTAATISTGAAALGAQSVNITSMSRSNNVVSVVTASAHGLPVGCTENSGSCPLVYIGNGNSLTDAIEFVGWFIVASVADTTHFTFQTGVDSRFGVLSTTSTGGTVTWWNANHLQLPVSNPAGVRQYAIYGRNCPGTCNLIGISMPVNASITSDPSYMAWDDFGSTMMGNATFPGWLPTTAPSTATNDTLTTTIVSGGTTTSIVTANAASQSISGATALIDSGPGLVSCVNATNSTGGACLIPVPTSSILSRYVINSYTNLGAVNTNAIIRQAGAVLLNDTIAWNNGQWFGNLQPSSGNGLMVRPGFSLEAHTPITVNAAYPGLYITGGMSMRGIVFNTSVQNLYNYIFSTSGGPVLFEDSGFAGASGNDLMGVAYYGFTSQGGGFGGNFRNFTFTSGTPNSSTVTPLFISKNNGEWNFHYGSCSNRGFTFIGGTNGGVNVLWDLGEECQAGSMPEIAMMSRGVGGSVSWQSGSLDTDANAAVANWTATGSSGMFVSGLGGAQTSQFSTLTGRQFVSVNTGSWLGSTAAQLGQNFNVFYGGVNGFIYDGQTNSGTAQKINQNQIIGPNYSSYTDPSIPAAPTCAVITAGPPFPPAGSYHFFYNPVFQNGGQGIASPASNLCTVDGATQQITVSYALVPGVVSYVWTLDGTNFPNVNGVNCLHTTSFPTASWTYEGGTCGFQSPPTWAGGGPAGFTGGKFWSNTFNLGQYADIAETSAPANPTAAIDRLYTDSTTHRLNCLTSTGANCLFPYAINPYSGNHQLLTTEQAVVGTATLTFTAPHAAAGRAWDVFCITPAVCTLTIDSGTLYGNGATGSFTIPVNTGTRVSCDGTNCYAESGGSGGGGGGSPGGSTNAIQYNGGGGSFGGVNSPITNGNYIVNYNVTASASVAPTITLPGVPVNAQTGTTYTIGAANTQNDRATLITATNSGAQTYTMVNPTTTGFGFNMPYSIWNRGTAAVTENASGFTVNGGASLLIPPNWVAPHWSDGINWFSARYPDFSAFPNCIDSVGQHINFTSSTGAFSCGTTASGTGLSGMTAGQVPIAASATTVTSSEALAGAGAAITTGPASSTTLDVVEFTGSGGQIADAGFLASNVWRKDAANVSGAVNHDFSAGTWKFPAGAGATAGATSNCILDTTNKNLHCYLNNADAIIGGFASAPANNNLVIASVSSSNVLLSGTTAIPNGTTATTQTAGDNTTDVATDAFVTTAVSNAIAAVNPAVAVLAATIGSSLTGTYSNGASGIGATFTITATGAFTLDGVAINTIGQRVLLKDQTSGFQNGVYTATIVGTTGISAVFTRALDYDQPSDINTTGAIPVQSGTVNADTSWLLTSTVNTVGTDALTFIQFTVAPTNLVTATTSATAAKQTCVSSGASKTCSYIDFPDSKSVPFAICVNGAAATGVTTTTAVGGTCRAGTNNKDAFIGPFTTSDSVTFKVHLPKDWDTGTAPSLSVDLASTDATAGHTVILQAATECSKLDGTTTDDVAFNTAQAMGTITLVATANQAWTTTLSSLTTTGCSAPGIMWVKITRTTDTATNVELYEADVTIPRLLTNQAN